MIVRGVVRGRMIELSELPPYLDGEEVEIEMARVHEPRKGSPAAVLAAMGALPDEDAEFILAAIEDAFERIEPAMWGMVEQ